MTKKVIAIAVWEVLGSLTITLFKLNFRLETPSFPSIALRTLSSSKACFFFSWLILAGGSGGDKRHTMLAV